MVWQQYSYIINPYDEGIFEGAMIEEYKDLYDKVKEKLNNKSGG